MKREEAVLHIIKNTIQIMNNTMRYEVLLNCWGRDQEEAIFNHLPDLLKHEILNSDEPPEYVMDDKYNVLIIEALKVKYIGVRNEFLSKRISELLNASHLVEGVQEKLLTCPCCEYQTLLKKGEYDICPVCFWEDDGNIDPQYYSSPNRMTLVQARENFINFGAVDKSSVQFLEADRLELYSKKI
ncbi:Cysteine-rich CPCC [Paenibacillus algorifonticola]|uniref:Cysteine-rich CPCC n=1 Tax=Paenibacillus algorifonticola TaxID=684063 RepID=A0A1I2ID62_9BACL|nr:CPCC family cysteine-rich protein [Paenibacillus algorifonticola]SFF40154.1 Cysteine-rich CPCC [Paenibacillus algorifonticola]